MRGCTLSLAVMLTVPLIHAAHSQNRTFGDFDCTDDCSGHSAGFKWAEKHGVEGEENCPQGNSQSFHEGCVAYTRDPSLDPDSDDNGNAVGAPMHEPDPEDDDDR
jgi:hypothetical protein